MEDVNLGINFDIKGALKSLDTLEKNSTKSVDGMTKAFNALKIVAGAAVAFFAGRKVVNFFRDGIAAAIKQEDAVNSLTAALDNNGQATQENIDRFVALGTELEKSTLFDDDVIINAAALAQSYGLTADQTENLVRASTELSAVMGIGLDASVKELGKTFNGQRGRVGQYIGEINSLTDAQLANGDAVDIVIQKFSGRAFAQTQTFSGAQNQLAKAIANVKEAFGQVIVQSPQILNIFNAMIDRLRELEAFILANGTALSEGLTKSLYATVKAIEVTLQTTRFFAAALNTVVGAGVAFGNGLVFLSSLLSQGFVKAAQAASFVIFELIDSLVSAGSILGKIPGFSGVGDAIEGIGERARVARINTESSFDLIDLRLRQTADRAVENTASFIGFAVGVDESLSKVASAAGATGRAILNADNGVIKSSENVGKARESMVDTYQITGKELEKLATDFAKFESDLIGASADELGKLQIARDAQLAKIKEFEDARVVEAERAAELRLQVEDNFARDALVITDKLYEDQNAKLQKQIEDNRKLVEQAAADPAAFIIGKLEIQEIDMKQADKEVVGLGLGITQAILDGASGARNLLVSGASALGDAILPGLGGAIGGVVGKLAEGPEATKEFVREFVESFPLLIEAIAEAAPAFVEQLVESLIVKGGIFKIARALTVGLLEGLLKGVPKIVDALFGGLKNGLGEVASIGRKVGGAITSSFSKAREAYVSAFNNTTGRIRGIFEKIKLPSIKLPEFKRPKWVDDIINFLKNFSLGGVTDSVKKGAGKVREFFGFNQGGIVPGGFPRDTGLAAVTSGERILSQRQTEAFERLVDELTGNDGSGQPIKVVLQVGENELAKTMLNINRRGFRAA